MKRDHPPHGLPAANDEAAQLASLKRLLIGPEQEDLAALRRDIDDPARQRQQVAAQLPAALTETYRDAPDGLIDALDAPVGACIRESVRRDPGFFGDILYPVMGPAIRRAISQAIRGLVQQINQSVEHSLTLKGLRWRLESARTGVPFGEIVLRHTLRFRVEEVFLIQGGSGLLIQHRGRTAQQEDDHDAMSAMLTAIRDFARDTFDQVDWREARLEAIDTGEHTLWLAHGPHAYLACAVRGVAPERLRDHFNDVTERLHAQFDQLLEGFDGDPASAATVNPLLDSCLQSESPPADNGPARWPAMLFLLALLGGAGWWAWTWWQAAAQHDARQALQDSAVAALLATPGIVVADRQESGQRLELVILADPLAADPASVIAASGLGPDAYLLRSHPFESADHEVALVRAARRLQPPPAVTLTLAADGTLMATGKADAEWQERAALLAPTIPGVAAFDTAGLQPEAEPLPQRLMEALQAPEGVEAVIAGDTAVIGGLAPAAWVAEVDRRARAVDGIRNVDSGSLRAIERLRLAELQETIAGFRLSLVELDGIFPAQQARLNDLAALASEAGALAAALSTDVRLAIHGRTDGTGTLEQNRSVATRRAALAAAGLRASGLQLPPLAPEARPALPGLQGPDPALRRVDFELVITERSGEPR
jgi:hypothetical protein